MSFLRWAKREALLFLFDFFECLLVLLFFSAAWVIVKAEDVIDSLLDEPEA
jgi:hypothetical protein